MCEETYLLTKIRKKYQDHIACDRPRTTMLYFPSQSPIGERLFSALNVLSLSDRFFFFPQLFLFRYSWCSIITGLNKQTTESLDKQTTESLRDTIRSQLFKGIFLISSHQTENQYIIHLAGTRGSILHLYNLCTLQWVPSDTNKP